MHLTHNRKRVMSMGAVLVTKRDKLGRSPVEDPMRYLAGIRSCSGNLIDKAVAQKLWRVPVRDAGDVTSTAGELYIVLYGKPSLRQISV